MQTLSLLDSSKYVVWTYFNILLKIHFRRNVQELLLGHFYLAVWVTLEVNRIQSMVYKYYLIEKSYSSVNITK